MQKALKSTATERKKRAKPQLRLVVGFLLSSAACFLLSTFCLGQTKIENPKSIVDEAQATEPEESSPPGDWAPELLDGILSSPNGDASDALHRAAFAAGLAIVPQLEAALKDDRTAEFAAQALAFVGGEKAMEVLSRLLSDPRDLDLRRFYYGALGEYSSPAATKVLLDAIGRSDAEPDRTVTEAAVLALTVRSDPNLVPELRQAETRIRDVVIRDDVENALDVIEARARYLASAEGKNAGGSVEEAVRTYFMPALETPAPPGAKPAAAGDSSSNHSSGQQSAAALAGKPGAPGRPAAPHSSAAKHATPAENGVKVEVRNLTLSPDKMRALARVVFEDPTAMANYDLVLEKQFGNWTVASVWLGSEAEKPAPALAPKAPHP